MFTDSDAREVTWFHSELNRLCSEIPGQKNWSLSYVSTPLSREYGENFCNFFRLPFLKKKRGPNIASSTFNSGFALKSFQVWENIPQSLILIGFQTNWLFATLSEAVFQWFISSSSLSTYMQIQTGLTNFKLSQQSDLKSDLSRSNF